MRYGRRMARPKLFPDVMTTKFREGTFARIEAVLRPQEDRTEFVRVAVETELERVEAILMGRIDGVLEPQEDRSSFVRAAVERELERREEAKGRNRTK
jgi:hypothetical protein